MKSKNPTPSRTSPGGLHMERWRKLYVSAVETSPEDLPDTEPSGNLARIFVVLLLVHVFLIGAIVLYNFMSDRPPRSTVVDNALTNTGVKGGHQAATVRLDGGKSAKGADGAQHYTVASGDTPALIAQKFGVEVSALVRENHLDQGSLYPEMDLIIPGKPSSKTAQASAPKTPDKPVPVAIAVPAPPAPAVAVKQDPPKGPTTLAQAKDKSEDAVPQARLVAPPPPAAEESTPPEATAEAATGGSTQRTPAPSVSKPSHTAETRTKERERDREDSPPPAKTSKSSEKVAASGKTHVVTSRDTLYSISRKYKVKVDDLMKLNNISDPQKLRDGTKLKIPQKN